MSVIKQNNHEVDKELEDYEDEIRLGEVNNEIHRKTER